jgi:hypothetical protein
MRTLQAIQDKGAGAEDSENSDYNDILSASTGTCTSCEDPRPGATSAAARTQASRGQEHAQGSKVRVTRKNAAAASSAAAPAGRTRARRARGARQA